jgi:hypothetical protein
MDKRFKDNVDYPANRSGQRFYTTDFINDVEDYDEGDDYEEE